jgi:autotransporter passenger strand-loop-strand repeat protein
VTTISLTTGPDTVVCGPGNVTVNGTATTLNPGDSLTGGAGNDVLALYGSGVFQVDQLATFTGFASITLNNFTNGYATLDLGAGQPITVTGYGPGYELVYLGSGAVTFHGGSSTYNAIVSTSASNWNAGDVIDGASSRVVLNGSGVANGNYDLTSNTLQNVNSLDGYGTNLTLKINSADAAGVSNFSGQGTNDQLVTSDTTLDLSHSSVAGFTVSSTNAIGTTFTVQDIGTAFQIAGGPGQDTIVADGFTFTADQRNAIFATASVETIVDSTGTYTANGPPTVNSGQTLSITSGQTSSGVIVLGGGILDVLSGGTAIGSVVSSGAIVSVSSGGIVSNTTVLSGGALDVLSGGLADPTTIDSGGLEVISAHGTDLGAQISGGEQDVSGLASGVTIFAGGSQVIESGGSATSTTVSNGGTLDVLSGGSAIGPHLLAGGTLVIGGTLSGYIVSSGVTLEVSGGTVSKTTVLSGGMLELLDGAAQSGTTISSGGTLEIGSGETLSGYLVSRGITLEAVLGGSVSSTKVLSGGTLAVLSGGTANGITVSNGGTATIASGAVVSGAGKISATGKGATLVVEGDIFTVGSGGVVLGSGAQMDLQLGQVSGALTIASGATVNALSGPSALLATSGKAITNSGLINVENGTTLTLNGTVINSGTLEVSATSSATALNLENAKISGGKLQTNGSNAVIETISGTSVIQGGTIVSGSLVKVTSGTQLNLNGGTVGKGATVETASGGTVIVSGTVTNSGTLFASGANNTIAIISVVNGGTAEVGDGVVDITKASSEAVSFQSGGTGGLILSDAIAYTGKLSGFGAGGNTNQFIDLTDVNIWSLRPLTYTPANAANTSGTLTVTDGTHTAHIKFVGTYTSASFTAVNDGTGGVKITDPPVVEQKPSAATVTDTVLESKVPESGKVAFASPTGKLWLDEPAAFAGTLAGLWAHDHTGLPGIGFDAHTTEDSGDAGGTLPDTDSTHGAKLALLGHYMATSFVTAAESHGGTLITEAVQAANQLVQLTTPHTG